eukprot:2476946-Prymnesium_polylepis.1
MTKLLSHCILEDYVGLHEMSFQGAELPPSDRHRTKLTDKDDPGTDSVSFFASLRPTLDPELGRVRWIFGLRL